MVVNVDVNIKVGNKDFSPSEYRKKKDDDTVDGKQIIISSSSIMLQFHIKDILCILKPFS